jgi:hypothetical protein
MPTSDAALRLSLADVEDQLDRGRNLHARIRCVDGRKLEGELLDVGNSGLMVLEASGVETHVLAHQLLTLDIGSPWRIREWLIAICVVPVVTSILIAFSRIPGVDPDRGDITIGFLLVAATIWALGRIPRLRKLWQGHVVRWDRLYPPRGA